MQGTSPDVILGSGAYEYRVDPHWAKLPPGYTMGDAAAVAVDAEDRVYVFNRSEHPMMIFDRDGNFLRSWGEGTFRIPHGLHVAPDQTIYCTDDHDHTVRKCTLDGKVLLLIGVPGKPAPYLSGEPFNRCTHTALSPKGEIYVSDGYGNARVHKYSPDGKLLFSWGEFGMDPGQFNVVHNVVCDAEGWVYIADRESHRVQVFDGNGKFETQWNNMHRPNALCIHGKQPLMYVAEGGPSLKVNRDFQGLGARVSVMTMQGEPIARVGGVVGMETGEFIAPHGLAVDSRGDIYVGEVINSSWPSKWPETKPPKGIRTLQKLIKTD